MPTHHAIWIDVMGAPQTIITADFDHDAQRVTVDGDTLGRMVEAIDAAGLFDEATTTEICRALWALRPNEAGHFDVTAASGDWPLWLELVVDCGCGHPSHPDRPCTGTGAELDPMYGIDPAERCVCTKSEED